MRSKATWAKRRERANDEGEIEGFDLTLSFLRTKRAEAPHLEPAERGHPRTAMTVMRPFEQASPVEFVRRADGPPEAVSGVSLIRAAGLFFDQSDDRLLPASWGVVLADGAAPVSSGTDST